mmetsp:Transcript_31126/g.78869  ORF Transcript_31126/g.78869 Transcript_31126/m.78869 type:complete len:235 (+) Transcript_31126:66-770(+)
MAVNDLGKSSQKNLSERPPLLARKRITTLAHHAVLGPPCTAELVQAIRATLALEVGVRARVARDDAASNVGLLARGLLHAGRALAAGLAAEHALVHEAIRHLVRELHLLVRAPQAGDVVNAQTGGIVPVVLARLAAVDEQGPLAAGATIISEHLLNLLDVGRLDGASRTLRRPIADHLHGRRVDAAVAAEVDLSGIVDPMRQLVVAQVLHNRACVVLGNVQQTLFRRASDGILR